MSVFHKTFGYINYNEGGPSVFYDAEEGVYRR